MDFGFSPGTTGQDGRARAMFVRRPGTTLVAVARRRTSVRDFSARVDAVHGANPVDKLLIATHANSQGVMAIPVFRGQRGPTTFEVLEDTIATAAHSIAIPAGIAPTNFDIKGCNLGQAQPFLVKLKEALGGGPIVTAPKHFHALYHHTRYGVWEAMAYEFRLHRHPRDRFANKAAAVAAFQGANFPLFDGTLVPPGEWAGWIPNRVDRESSRVVNETLSVPIGTRRTIPVPREFRFRRSPWTLTITFPTVNDVPRSPAARMAELDSQIRADPRFDAGHDFPEFRRWGYANVDEFIDGFDWRFGRSGTVLVCTGTRLDYTVIVAIRDTSVVNRGNLLSNFYPNAGSPHAAIQTDLRVTDPMFFGSA